MIEFLLALFKSKTQSKVNEIYFHTKAFCILHARSYQDDKQTIGHDFKP